MVATRSQLSLSERLGGARSNMGLGAAASSNPPGRYDSQQGPQSPVHGPCVRERLGYVRV